MCVEGVCTGCVQGVYRMCVQEGMQSEYFYREVCTSASVYRGWAEGHVQGHV